MEAVAAEIDPVTGYEAGTPVGDHLVVAASDRAAFDDPLRASRSAELKADDVEAELGCAICGLGRLKGHGTCCHHTWKPRDGFPRVAGDAGRFGEWPARAGLHHPDIHSRATYDGQGFDDEAAIDAHHREHDAEQQPEPDAGQDEPEEVVAHIPPGEVHGLPPSMIRVARPSQNSLRLAVTRPCTLGHATRDHDTTIERAGAELHYVIAEASVLDNPYTSRRSVKALDRVFWHEHSFIQEHLS